MQIDFLGTDSVLKFIEASKLSKYKIERATNANGSYISVYEFNDSNTNTDAVNDFKRAAEFINPNVVYKITLYDFADVETDAHGITTAKKSKGKAGKQAGHFTLNSSAINTQSNHIHNANNGGNMDFASLRAELISEISKKQEENLILNELKELKLKFAALEEEEEEEEEQSIAGIRPEQLTQLAGLINMFKGGAPATINGTTDVNDKTVNINKAIKILYKHDQDLDTDLLKLAEIAETKNETFKMLISSLRSL